MFASRPLRRSPEHGVRAILIDCGVAAILSVVTVLQYFSGELVPMSPIVVGGALLAAVAMAARTRVPLLVTLLVVAGVLGQVAGGATVASFGSFIAILVCAYSAARLLSSLRLALALLAIVATVVITGVVGGVANAFEVVYPIVYVGGAIAIGVAVRSWRRSVERQQEDQARLAVAEERASIAREVHDVLAHGMTLIVLHAEAAAALLEKDPARAIEPIEVIQRTGRQSIEEMRHLLALLRGPDSDEPGTRPRLADIDRVVQESSTATMATSLTMVGQPFPVSDGLQLAVYRIVQEALTNALRHSGAGEVRVTITFRQPTILVDVLSAGAARTVSARPAGHGLVGMRERTRMYGGAFTAERTPDGFLVHASLSDVSGWPE